MPDCRYCEQSFDTEDAIREHLHNEHDQEELGRIDRKRVEQYIKKHGLAEPDETGSDESTDEQAINRIPFRDSHRESVLSHGRWELSEVRDLATEDIVDNLDTLGIETTEETFRQRADGVDSAYEIFEQWLEQYEVDVSGHDEDFVLMVAEVLWERWAPGLPNRERIHDFIEDGRGRLEQGQRVNACQQWLTAWEFIKTVTPDSITSLEEAEQHLPAVYSIESVLLDLETELATAAETDPTLHGQRIEFCREFCDRFPDSNRELRLEFRHAIAESLAELGHETDSRSEFEAIIETYPADPRAYFKLGDSYWHDAPEMETIDDAERAVEMYQLALDRDVEQPMTVSKRLEEVQQWLADTGKSDEE